MPSLAVRLMLRSHSCSPVAASSATTDSVSRIANTLPQPTATPFGPMTNPGYCFVQRTAPVSRSIARIVLDRSSTYTVSPRISGTVATLPYAPRPGSGTCHAGASVATLLESMVESVVARVFR